MKIYIVYKFRGVDEVDLINKLKRIHSVLDANGHKTFSYSRDIANWKCEKLPQGQVIKEAFEEIKKYNIILCFVEHQKLSEGMLLEIGFAKALKKKIILLISKKCSFPMLEGLSDQVIKIDNIKDLSKELAKI